MVLSGMVECICLIGVVRIIVMWYLYVYVTNVANYVISKACF